MVKVNPVCEEPPHPHNLVNSMTKVKSTDVFTPSTPARYSFVERRALNDQLVDALRTPGKQVVVYGPSGSGKTTLLLNKLEQLYPNHITTRCTLATTFDSLLLGAFDSLNMFYTSGASLKRSKSISVKLEKDFFAIKSVLEASCSAEQASTVARLLPPQLTAQRLAEFCGAAECCWVLEDFHKVPISEKAKLSQIMKVFMDTAAEFPSVKIVAIGAVDSARDVVQYDTEMRNRVTEIAVPLMLKDELLEVMQKGENLLNIRLHEVKHDIAEYASGLAAVCHQLCLNICFAAEVVETCDKKLSITKPQMRSALNRYLADASDTLKAVFDLATKQRRSRTFDNTRLILKALTTLGATGGTHGDILKAIRADIRKYPAGNLTTYLRELQSSSRGEVLRFDPFSGKYFFRDPLYLAYSLCLFSPAQTQPSFIQAHELVKQRLREEVMNKIKISFKVVFWIVQAVPAPEHMAVWVGRLGQPGPSLWHFGRNAIGERQERR
jgi:energy-coupling factor transporter ATP-binding protein EcfA2